MDEGKVVRLLRAFARLEEEERRRRWVEARSGCIPLPRFRTARLGRDWTPDERRHLQECSRCRRVEVRARSYVWHPGVGEVWRFLRGRLPTEVLQDVADHLERDRCRRCRWVEAVLRPLAGGGPAWRAALSMRAAEPAIGFLHAEAALPLLVPEAAGLEPLGLATETPIPLTEAPVVLKSQDMQVCWRPTPEAWVVRARVRRPPHEGARVRFSLADPQGDERWHAEVPLEPGPRRGWVAEARMPPRPDLPEAYLMALVIPPRPHRFRP